VCLFLCLCVFFVYIHTGSDALRACHTEEAASPCSRATLLNRLPKHLFKYNASPWTCLFLAPYIMCTYVRIVGAQFLDILVKPDEKGHMPINTATNLQQQTTEE
jgi:hypothetical protein